MTTTRCSSNPRGLILIVVLVVVVLLALLAASYTFMVQAHVRATMTERDHFQARMAAQSGIERAVVLLRENRNDPGKWYDNPAVFHGAIVYTESKDAARSELIERETYDPSAPPTWRFSLMAPNYDNRSTVRYGITDECSKININTATEEQLRRLFDLTIPRDSQHPVDIEVLVQSLLDWREPGEAARPSGAKSDYYQSQRPPYRCKGAPFATVEELLMVRGFSGWVLYGEDYNRNGMLDPNEDDGTTTFPPDNSDGTLFVGLAPYLTLWSNETNLSADGRPKINLNMENTQDLQAALEAEIRPELTSYVMQVRTGGTRFNSVMNLIPAPPPDPEEEGEVESKKPSSQPVTSRPTGSQPTSQPSKGMSGDGRSGSSDQNAPGSEKSGKAPVFKDLTPTPPPGTYDDLPQILDRLTVNPAPFLTGRINVSTAPREVLAAIEELSPEQVTAIAAARSTLRPEDRTTAAWLLRSNAISENKFRQIFNKITTGSSAFTIESVGYADHTGVVERINVVLEMRGPMPQYLYTRNLAKLGPAYRPHGIEQRGTTERVR
ncbi:MAG: hypothetical protein AABZ08_07175 [Planctomycetota bacterium]